MFFSLAIVIKLMHFFIQSVAIASAEVTTVYKFSGNN